MTYGAQILGRLTFLLSIGIGVSATLPCSYALTSYQRGGSNYWFYESVPSGGNGFGPITDYNLTCNSQGCTGYSCPGYADVGQPVSSIINCQLAAMAANGQQVWTLDIYFSDDGQGGGSVNGWCPSAGTAGQGGTINSATAFMPPACISNMIAIIRAAKSYGLGPVRIAFKALYPNDAYGWSSWDQYHSDQNWDFIKSVHDALTTNGIYTTFYDLGNEDLPPSGTYPLVIRYDRELWSRYTATYGTSDTSGFSVSCDGDCPSRLASMSNAYYGQYPGWIDLHIYGNECNAGSSVSTYQAFVSAVSYLESAGLYKPFIIGEACLSPYDNGEPTQLLNAHNATGWPIVYVQQFPESYQPVPTNFTDYVNAGF
jgi:hypothetical protein